MPDSQITVTAPTGPAQLVTAQVIKPVRSLLFELSPLNILTVIDGSGKAYQFDINATTTVTFTIAVGVGTVVVSQ